MAVVGRKTGVWSRGVHWLAPVEDEPEEQAELGEERRGGKD